GERGNLRVRQFLDVLQNERFAVDRIDLIERTLDVGTVLRSLYGSAPIRDRVHLAGDATGSHGTAKGTGATFVYDDPEEPVLELLRLAVPGNGLEGSQVRGLEGLVRDVVVAEHTHREAGAHVAITANEAGERGYLSLGRGGDELAIGELSHVNRTAHAPK